MCIRDSNGGGKTTLLHCLSGLVRPRAGTVRVCGLDVPVTPASRVARQLGVVFQNADHQLVEDTVWNEAVFALRNFGSRTEAGVRRAGELLRQAGLADRIADHPFGLSWGQKRRLNLISSILHRPRLLLLDEPFAGQDWENAAFLMQAIRAVVGGPAAEAENRPAGACVLVTHDPRIVQRLCSRVVFLAGGRVVLDGPTPEVFKRLIESGNQAYAPVGCAAAQYAPASAATSCRPQGSD